MCPLLDTCPNPDVSSDNFHWTQVLPIQHILCNRFLFAITGGQKNNFNYRFKLEPVITCYLKFIVNLL